MRDSHFRHSGISAIMPPRRTPVHTHLIIVLCVAAATQAATPTPVEQQALAALGSGFVVYSRNGAIIKYVLDGTGIVSPKVLYEAANTEPRLPRPMVSSDGRHIFYRVCPDDTNCEVWRMDTNGDNKQRFSRQSYPFAAWFKQSWKAPDRMLFASSLHPDDIWRHTKLWVMDDTGAAEMAIDFDPLITDWSDICGDLLAYRKDRSQVWIYNRVTGKEFMVSRQATCNPTFSPDGDLLMINRAGHRSYYIFQRTTDTSLTLIDSTIQPMQLSAFKWSSDKHWVTMISELIEPQLGFAQNIYTKEYVRVVFEDSGVIQYINLWLDGNQHVRYGPAFQSAHDRFSVALREGGLTICNASGRPFCAVIAGIDGRAIGRIASRDGGPGTRRLPATHALYLAIIRGQDGQSARLLLPAP
jgi:hypothetical protein